MIFALCIALGFAPSLIWLSYYLRKDVHPEPKRMIVKIFAAGMAITFAAAFFEIGVEMGIQKTFSFIGENVFLSSVSVFLYGISIIFLILSVAFIEEFLKYMVIKESVLKDPEFDEPVDAIIYMIIAGLGFAAVENILVLFSLDHFFSNQTIYVIGLRFIGATLLHALCSGALGYFLALSFYKTSKRAYLVFSGITIAVLLHALYNFSIIKASDNFIFILIPVILLICLSIFVSLGFAKLKLKTGLCAIK